MATLVFLGCLCRYVSVTVLTLIITQVVLVSEILLIILCLIMITVFPRMSAPALINFKISVPRAHQRHFFLAPVIIMSSFDPAFIRDQVFIWEPSLERGNTVSVNHTIWGHHKDGVGQSVTNCYVDSISYFVYLLFKLACMIFESFVNWTFVHLVLDCFLLLTAIVLLYLWTWWSRHIDGTAIWGLYNSYIVNFQQHNVNCLCLSQAFHLWFNCCGRQVTRNVIAFFTVYCAWTFMYRISSIRRPTRFRRLCSF